MIKQTIAAMMLLCSFASNANSNQLLANAGVYDAKSAQNAVAFCSGVFIAEMYDMREQPTTTEGLDTYTTIVAYVARSSLIISLLSDQTKITKDDLEPNVTHGVTSYVDVPGDEKSQLILVCKKLVYGVSQNLFTVYATPI